MAGRLMVPWITRCFPAVYDPWAIVSRGDNAGLRWESTAQSAAGRSGILRREMAEDPGHTVSLNFTSFEEHSKEGLWPAGTREASE